MLRLTHTVFALILAGSLIGGCQTTEDGDGDVDAGADASADVADDTSDATQDATADDTGADADPSDAGDDGGDDAQDATDTGASNDADDASGDAGRECEATHERVGWTAELSNLAHNVGGTAEIVDNCTVRISNFTYDGQGLDVRLYGASGTDFENGYPMTDDLVRDEPYSGETITAKLPIGESLDDLDSVSVWCVDVSTDFGSGTFSAP